MSEPTKCEHCRYEFSPWIEVSLNTQTESSFELIGYVIDATKKSYCRDCALLFFKKREMEELLQEQKEKLSSINRARQDIQFRKQMLQEKLTNIEWELFGRKVE